MFRVTLYIEWDDGDDEWEITMPFAPFPGLVINTDETDDKPYSIVVEEVRWTEKPKDDSEFWCKCSLD